MRAPVLLLFGILCASAGTPLSAQPAAADTARLKLELRRIENQATVIGRGATFQANVDSVRARRIEAEEQMRRLDEAMPRMRVAVEQIDSVRRAMDAEWVFTPQDAGEEAVEEAVTHYVEMLLGAAARRVAFVAGMVLDVAEYGGKQYIKSVNVAALEEQVRRGRVDIELVYAIYRAMDIEARKTRLEEARLRQLQDRWAVVMEELSRARRRAAGDAALGRERDAAGDREVEREAARDRMRVWSVGWYETAAEHRGESGRFAYLCPPYAGGSAGVWGTDVYTYDSSICMAAVHAGFITQARGGHVTIEMRAAPGQFRGSARNGVTSSSWEGVTSHHAFAVVGG